MARVTVEDCVLVVPNRFELCLMASYRAKSIISGAATVLDRKEKPSVISLREIAEKHVDVDNIKHNIFRGLKNRSTGEFKKLIDGESTDVILEDIEEQNMILKDNMFVEDNVEVDD